MIAFWTILSSLSLELVLNVALPAELRLSPNSKSTLIRKCFNKVLKTSRTVGPGNSTEMTVLVKGKIS